MDIQKAFKVAMLPAGAAVGLFFVGGLLSVIIGLIPVINTALCCTGPIFFLAEIAAFGGIGYYIKQAKLELMDAAAVGAVTGIVSSVVLAIFAITSTLLGLSAVAALNGLSSDSGLSAAIAGVGAIVIIIVECVFWVIGGAVLAVIGYVLGPAQKTEIIVEKKAAK